MNAAIAFGSVSRLQPLGVRCCAGVWTGRSSHGTHGTCGHAAAAAATWHKISCKQLEIASALRRCGRKGGAPRLEYRSLAYCFHSNGLSRSRVVDVALCSLGDLAQVRQMEGGEDEDALQRERLDNITEQLTASSALPFLLLMMPQIIKNADYLMAGNKSPLSILPWMGYTTGLLGNMLLLTYFSEKKEMSATIVQVVGVVSTFVLLSQVRSQDPFVLLTPTFLLC
ncbi:hypothetical protein CBR_g17688 [Chara braunii]|uniref:Uncharacterized protein n=1 Tax=Chara braunii TaxID=69332 RepID=A0A388KV89_CHABU|nr:hypothetical protein CBR_g17688 [Chara braunii]|eukprot:GBG73976.1 hypothetical protein CBR_g17688 [Chara braunii]